MERYVNLGPIVDFCVVDLERQGQGQVVTYSGAYKDGSLRIVRNGIGNNEQASVELQGIKGMWSLRSSTDDPFDTFLVVSFISETRILAMNLEDELEEIEIEGFCSQVKTLFGYDAVYNHLVQRNNKLAAFVLASNRDNPSSWQFTSIKYDTMQAPYYDPRTNLRYANTDVFKIIRSLPNEYVQRYLATRNAQLFLNELCN
ncbi:DNA damage-binding protein [Quillaja saponaria]|uniref:DNA damage-binding protein n=1 Tax=Quillaja saponaria TaxID=32244 RepID=A0AAD7PM29_QUISA|nr:DNA damage-binding protein [Quillaja saponaria]